MSVSETTDITDVTAKSHSINSYSTSLQAEIGSGCQGHFGANNSNAAAAAYRYHRHHLNLDTSMINSKIVPLLMINKRIIKYWTFRLIGDKIYKTEI